MSSYDTDAAQQALEAAIDADSGTSEPSVPSSGANDAGTTSTDSFTSVDPNTLAPELQEIYRSMQGDYTRGKQDLANRQREFDSFGGVEQVRSAVEFVTGLQDPDNLVQLHTELSEYLQSQGLNKAQADTAAADHLTTQSAPTQGEEDWDYSDPQADALKRELDQIRSQNSELQQWRQQMEQERVQTEIEQHLGRQESAIRQSNPSYTDEDMGTIYHLSYAFGGDLDRAQQVFEGERNRILSTYVSQKQNIPEGVSSPLATGGAQSPDTFGSDFEAAHKHAKQIAAGLMGNPDFG